MSKVVKFRARTGKQSIYTNSFPKIVALAIVGSFVMGAGTAHFLGDKPLVAQASSAGSSIVTVYREGQQANEQASTALTKPATSYRHCVGSVRINCIVDGDTLWSNGVKIRVADIDAPEVSEPRCAAEKALGDRATVRFMELVNAGPFELQAWPGRDVDKYGRKLRVLVRDGRSLGGVLVSEGLARTWTGRRQPWC
jgi:endonuclease YncB( thermonuclease family)